MEAIQRAVICAIHLSTESESRFEHRMDELKGLCEAAGVEVAAVYSQERDEVQRSLYLGSGKVTEIANAISDTDVELSVFDGELSPTQVRNLESRLMVRVIDRTQLILDIFAMRARTHEGRLQVEIAQLQYLLPRLTGLGVEMSRLGGGVGTRGPGETKLEMDRRRIRSRISHLETKLKSISRHRETQRRKRVSSVPVVALVGYTNAGKTTLLERWTRDHGGRTTDGGNQRLFDTLDPVARRVKAGPNGSIVVMDTVGFIEDLPHLLVDAFRATLEEANTADLIVQVVDSKDNPNTRLETTYQVLKEIDALDKPIITFFNKMDCAEEHPLPDSQAAVNIYGSAVTGEGLERLYEETERLLGLEGVEVEVVGDPKSREFWSEVMALSKVLEVDSHSEDEIHVRVQVERRLRDDFLQRFSSQQARLLREDLERE